MIGLRSMWLRNIVVVAIFLGIGYAVAVTGYALQARDSAIRGWAAAGKLNQELSADERANTEYTEYSSLQKRAYKSLWYYIVGDININSDLEFAKAVTDYIYRNVPIGTKDVPGSYAFRMINALSAKGEEALCGDLSIFLNEVLNASGIKSRIVQLATDKFVKGEADLDTHVTVEAYLDGKWMIVDPTFNATLTCGQGTVFIDAKEAHDCVEAGKELVPHYGETKLPGRLMSQYYVPVPTLYENYAYQVKTDDGNYKTVFQAPRPDWLTLAVERLQKEHVN